MYRRLVYPHFPKPAKPRMCGDVPHKRQIPPPAEALNPACAGMYLRVDGDVKLLGAKPRMCGDVPHGGLCAEDDKG